jgi:excisionase family DNA binding protein
MCTMSNENVTVVETEHGALKTKEAAQYLRLQPVTLRRLVQRGLLKANRATRHMLFSREELERFLRS